MSYVLHASQRLLSAEGNRAEFMLLVPKNPYKFMFIISLSTSSCSSQPKSRTSVGSKEDWHDVLK